jgi:hypothetical protein
LDFEFDLVNYYLASLKQQINTLPCMDGLDSEWTQDLDRSNDLLPTQEGDDAGTSSNKIESEKT